MYYIKKFVIRGVELNIYNKLPRAYAHGIIPIQALLVLNPRFLDFECIL